MGRIDIDMARLRDDIISSRKSRAGFVKDVKTFIAQLKANGNQAKIGRQQTISDIKNQVNQIKRSTAHVQGEIAADLAGARIALFGITPAGQKAAAEGAKEAQRRREKEEERRRAKAEAAQRHARAKAERLAREAAEKEAAKTDILSLEEKAKRMWKKKAKKVSGDTTENI